MILESFCVNPHILKKLLRITLEVGESFNLSKKNYIGAP